MSLPRGGKVNRCMLEPLAPNSRLGTDVHMHVVGPRHLRSMLKIAAHWSTHNGATSPSVW
jgi:hypothetical protein